MHKGIIFLLFVKECVSFYISNNINFLRTRTIISNSYLERRDILKNAKIISFPYIFKNFPKFSLSEKDKCEIIEDLREKAYRIIEIINIQKDNLNIPMLEYNIKDSNNKYSLVTIKEAKNIGEKEEIKKTLDNILNNFKKNGKENPYFVLNNLQSFCSETNPIKSKSVLKLKQLFADGNYGIFLGKFDNYYITNYNKVYDTNTDNSYYEVDVKIEADYNTMIYNSIQFDELNLPEFSGDPYFIYYKWIFIKKDKKYYLDTCYLLKKNEIYN